MDDKHTGSLIMIKHYHRTFLSDCPPVWDVAPLADLLRKDGSQSGDWGDDVGDVPLLTIRSTNFTNDGHFDLSDVTTRYFSRAKSESLAIRANDILLEKSGGSPVQPVGRVLLATADMPGYGFGNFIHRLRPNEEKVLPRFLRWVLHEVHRSGVVERVQNQTTQMRNLELRDYYCMRLPLPSRDEQLKISDILDSIDECISHTRSMLGIAGSLRKDNMGGPLNELKKSALHNLIRGIVRVV